MQENSVEEVNLFSPAILDRLPIIQIPGLIIRPLRNTDYEKGKYNCNDLFDIVFIYYYIACISLIALNIVVNLFSHTALYNVIFSI